MMNEVPDQDKELLALSPLTPLLYEGFEHSTELACAYFENTDRDIDAPLFPEIVRYEMKGFLERNNQIVEDLNREEIGHNGLCVTFASRRIRMWKADDEHIPAAESKVRRDFLNQQLALFVQAGQFKPVERNLVVLWKVDGAHRLHELYLVCPKWSSNDGLKTEAYWTTKLPHPAVRPPDGMLKSPNTRGKDLPITALPGGDHDNL